MKLRTLFFLLGIAFPLFLFAQQPFNQHSLGGTPWMFKFDKNNDGISFIDMPAFDMNQVLMEDSVNNTKGRSYRFGYDHLVDYHLNNSGTWTQLESGDYMWTLGIRSPGAVGMSVSFANIILPPGCRLYIMNEDHSEYHGAFDETFASVDTRMMATEQLTGESVVLELFVPEDLRNIVSLDLYRVTHIYKDIFDAARSFGDSDPCENNVRCPAYASRDNQIRSVVCLVNGGEFCSGALINNTCNDGKAFVLTANHCGTTPGGWTFRFNWEAPGCPNPGSSPASNSLTGGTFRAAWDGSDFFLCEITAAGAVATLATYDVYYAGWNRTTTATTNPFGIHHPSGDIKKFSQSTGTASPITINFNTNANTQMWQTPTWTDGVTEQGSSGSPLFNSSGLIIGQLAGGPSNCGCENNAGCGFDYYGRLSVSWAGNGTNATRLSNWLDPAACVTGATTLNGYDPNTPSLTYDAQVQSITSPSGTLCTGSFSPVIVIKNNGTTLLTGMTINYQIDGGGATPYAWSGSLASGATTNVTMPSITIAAGAHTYTATIVTASLNGSNTDLNTANNSLTSNYTGIVGTGMTLPFTEGFQNVTFPPTNWTNENPDNNVTYAQWFRTTTAGGFGGSSASAKIDQYNPATPGTVGQLDNLITPFIDFTTQGTPINLTFSVANARYDVTNYDSLIVWISTNCGSNWTRLASYGNNSGPNQLATAPDNQNAFTPTAAQWATKTINLDSYAGQPSAKIRFQLKSGWGNNTFVDDVNITGTVLSPPTASFTTSSNTICAGQTVTYTNTSTGGATSINWAFPGGSPASGTTSPIIVTYPTAGSYTATLTATNVAGSTTATQTITVNALPTNTASNTGAYCPGATIQLNATAGASDYDWVGPNSYVQNNTQNPTILNATTAMGGVYTVTVTNAAGCSATATTNVAVNPAPTSTASNAGPYCPGSTIQLNSTGSATNDWAGPNSYIQNNIQNPTIPGATLAMDGIYTVTVTNGFGCSATATTTVIVVNASSGTAGNSGPYCVGQTIALDALAGGTGYAWTGPNSYSDGTQNPTIPSSTVSMAGVYSVTITFTGGCTSSATTTVVVNTNPLAPVITPGGPTTFCSGNSVTLTSSYPTDNVWSTTATTAAINVNSTGTYIVTYTDVNGCTSTASQLVTVNSLPAVTQSNLGTVCLSYAPIILSGGSPAGGTYSGTAVSAGQFDPAIAGTGSFNITYTYTDGNGCTNNAIAPIIVSPCIGIEDNITTVASIYPNPTEQIVYITGLEDKVYDFAIINTLGQTIKVGKLYGDGSIDLGIVATGTYYLKIDTQYWKIIRR